MGPCGPDGGSRLPRPLRDARAILQRSGAGRALRRDARGHRRARGARRRARLAGPAPRGHAEAAARGARRDRPRPPDRGLYRAVDPPRRPPAARAGGRRRRGRDHGRGLLPRGGPRADAGIEGGLVGRGEPPPPLQANGRAHPRRSSAERRRRRGPKPGRSGALRGGFTRGCGAVCIARRGARGQRADGGGDVAGAARDGGGRGPRRGRPHPAPAPAGRDGDSASLTTPS